MSIRYAENVHIFTHTLLVLDLYIIHIFTKSGSSKMSEENEMVLKALPQWAWPVFLCHFLPKNYVGVRSVLLISQTNPVLKSAWKYVMLSMISLLTVLLFTQYYKYAGLIIYLAFTRQHRQKVGARITLRSGTFSVPLRLFCLQNVRNSCVCFEQKVFFCFIHFLCTGLNVTASSLNPCCGASVQ